MPIAPVREQTRKHVRLAFYRGRAVLLRAGLPPVQCLVLDLSEGGCRCRVDLSGLDGASAEAWVGAMRPGAAVDVEIQSGARLQPVRFGAEVRHADSSGKGLLELGFEFCNLTAEQRQQLAQALQFICQEQLRELDQAKLAQEPPPDEGLPAPALTRVTPELRARTRGARLGEILVHLGLLTEAQLAEGLQEAREKHVRIGRCLLERHWLSPDNLCQALSLQSGLPTVDLTGVDIPTSLYHRFSYLTMRRLELLPFQQGRNVLSIAAARPLAAAEVAELEQKVGHQVMVYLAPEDLVLTRIMSFSAPRRQERHHPRYRVEFTASCQFRNREGDPLNDRTVYGKVFDVSEGGFGVEGEDPEAGPVERFVRDGVSVNILVSAGTRQIHAACAVRFAKTVETANPFVCCLFGFQILEISEADRSLLRELCIRTAIRGMQKRPAAHR